VRAVLDPNVVISGILSARGTPAELLRAFDHGEFEVVVSPKLIGELTRALAYPKLRRHVSADEAGAIVAWIVQSAAAITDPDDPPPVRSADPGDDYLVALAAAERVALVSGDKHLLALAGQIPVFSPREFLDLLQQPGRAGA
jgi:putative PIN family toxin of toxin-antitoxin system